MPKFPCCKHVLLALVLAAALPGVARADTFGFTCITDNNLTDCETVYSQLRMEVTAGGTTQVNFRFTNLGPAPSSITDVYFSDLVPQLLSTPAYITSSVGVQFSAGCTPGNLPGGTPYGFSTSYCADSDSPVQPMGVNPGEWLNIAYTLQGGATFDTVLAAIYAGDYSVGIHTQGFASGGSESSVARVPEPPALLLVGTAALLAFRRRLSIERD